MAQFELKLPKMGESVAEATITSWLKEVGDTIELDDSIVEIATDKVDSEVPSEVEGVLIEKRFNENDVVKVGETIAIIETSSEDSNGIIAESIAPLGEDNEPNQSTKLEQSVEKAIETVSTTIDKTSTSGKFYSPLVRNIAEKEGITMSELEIIQGTGKDGRVTKSDILNYIENRGTTSLETTAMPHVKKPVAIPTPKVAQTVAPVISSSEDEIIELSRMGKLIAGHMLNSIHSAAHVQSFIEVDVTNVVKWRESNKYHFFQREGVKLTYTPIFMQAVARAWKEFPLLNMLVEGEDKVIKKKNVNLGMATALSDGNLIVPVIKNADQLNLVGMAKSVNSLA